MELSLLVEARIHAQVMRVLQLLHVRIDQGQRVLELADVGVGNVELGVLVPVDVIDQGLEHWRRGERYFRVRNRERSLGEGI